MGLKWQNKDIIYQKYYDTGWTPEDNQHNNKQGKVIWDIPDIIITFWNNKVIIIDAKNSDLNKSKSSLFVKSFGPGGFSYNHSTSLILF